MSLPSDPICRIGDCRAPATHVLLLQRYSWHREAVLASAAPPIQVRARQAETDTNATDYATTPTPYYCRTHAEEKAYAH